MPVYYMRQAINSVIYNQHEAAEASESALYLLIRYIHDPTDYDHRHNLWIATQYQLVARKYAGQAMTQLLSLINVGV